LTALVWLAVGTYMITAVYSGADNFQGSTSPVLKQIVNREASSDSVFRMSCSGGGDPTDPWCL